MPLWCGELDRWFCRVPTRRAAWTSLKLAWVSHRDISFRLILRVGWKVLGWLVMMLIFLKWAHGSGCTDVEVYRVVHLSSQSLRGNIWRGSCSCLLDVPLMRCVTSFARGRVGSIQVSILFFIFGFCLVYSDGLSPAGRTAYVLCLPKHLKMGENLMFVECRCRRRRYTHAVFSYPCVYLAFEEGWWQFVVFSRFL